VLCLLAVPLLSMPWRPFAASEHDTVRVLSDTGRGLIPNLGSLVQVHFSESRGERVAALVVAEGAQLPLTPVKHLGQSVRGETRRCKSRTVVVEIDGHTRDVVLNDDTRLVDRNGSVRAVGTKAIAAALAAGTKVLVTWKPFWVTDGSGAVTGYYLDAETIRMITVSPLDEKNALTAYGRAPRGQHRRLTRAT
jgi:hypothetical protein